MYVAEHVFANLESIYVYISFSNFAVLNNGSVCASYFFGLIILSSLSISTVSVGVIKSECGLRDCFRLR